LDVLLDETEKRQDFLGNLGADGIDVSEKAMPPGKETESDNDNIGQVRTRTEKLIQKTASGRRPTTTNTSIQNVTTVPASLSVRRAPFCVRVEFLNRRETTSGGRSVLEKRRVRRK
jgi:hypothetical protein